VAKNIIRFDNVSKFFEDVRILKEINLNIKENEFFTLLGPSGCGKTTILRIIGGFDFPSSGSIFFEDKNITDLTPNQLNLNTVFQKYALFPHLNVYENISFGLKVKKVSENIIRKKVSEILELVHLNNYEKRDISSLSGGQQQRVAIARALVNEPKVLLLDEPLSALDLKMRKNMQIELKKVQRELGITFVYVTHDQEEALTMSDRLAVLNNGTIQQIGDPIDIYNEPINKFIANFIGESNIVTGTMLQDKLVCLANKEFICVDFGFERNESVDVVIRPEDVKVFSYDDTCHDNYNKNSLDGIVKSVIFKGVHYEMIINANNISWMVHSTYMFEKNSNVKIIIMPNDIHIMRK